MKKVSVDLFRAAPYMLTLVLHKDALFHCKFTLADSAALSAKKDSNSYVSNDPGNTKRGSITVPLTSCLTGLESAV
jgi:hypothetical protein